MKKEFAAANNLMELNEKFRNAVRPFGFSGYAVGFIPDVAVEADADNAHHEPFLLLDWPKEWLELYARQGFAADDVVIAEAARTTLPFTWSEIQRRLPGVSARVFAAAASFGWHDGFAIPIHDAGAEPGERFGIASLAAASLAEFGAPARLDVVKITLAAFSRARALRRQVETPPFRLSVRERQSLSLVAKGCSDAQIAKTLNVSVTTAHFYVESAKKRLGATTRAQAVATALLNDLLKTELSPDQAASTPPDRK